jgi:hypothetical protein
MPSDQTTVNVTVATLAGGVTLTFQYIPPVVLPPFPPLTPAPVQLY